MNKKLIRYLMFMLFVVALGNFMLHWFSMILGAECSWFSHGAYTLLAIFLLIALPLA